MAAIQPPYLAAMKWKVFKAYNGLVDGTVPSYVTVDEGGNAVDRWAKLTFSTTLPAIAGGANLAVGKLIYTLPAGELLITGSSMSAAITQADGNITADTPDVGIGTTIGSGAVAVLSGTAAFENILTGQTAADCDGTATVATVATNLVVATAGNHTVYLNVADGWAASGDAGAALTGTVYLSWKQFS